MSFGAMLTDANGVPFYIQDTSPLTLINTITFSAPTDGSVSKRIVSTADDSLKFIFVQSSSSWSDHSCEWAVVEQGNWVVYASTGGGVIRVYVFGFQYQSIPKWGVQINDAAGNCILTNESKVLRDVRVIGDQSVESNSGYKLSQTFDGAWAVAPSVTGIFNAVDVGTSQPRPIVATYYSSARYNGSQTLINSGYYGSMSGGNIQNPTYQNGRCRLTAVNVDRY